MYSFVIATVTTVAAMATAIYKDWLKGISTKI